MVGDGVSYSVMMGLGETYLAAFALALGMGQVVAGLVASIPLIGGAILQLVTPAAVMLLGSNRRWVVFCAAVQATTFLPLVVAAIVGWVPVPVLFAIVAVYWGTNMACGPAWNTWASTLVPQSMRARFFSRRTRFMQAGLLLGYVAGGLALQAGAALNSPLTAFAIIFLAAAAFRFISAAFLTSQSEPEPPDASHRIVSVPEVLRRFRHGGDGRLLLYLVLMHAGAQICGPYFAPFMLKQLDFSYASYMIVCATGVLAKTLTLPTIGKLTQRFGARKMLTWSGLAVIPLSALWIVSGSIWWLIGVQIIAGASWAVYELAMFLLFMERIDESERTSVLTTYNLCHATATVCGATLGGVLISQMGETHTSYLVVFGLSGVARLLTIPFLRRIPDSQHLPGAAEMTGAELQAAATGQQAPMSSPTALGMAPELAASAGK